MKDIDMNVHLGEERKQRFKTLCKLNNIKPSRKIKEWIDKWTEELTQKK